MANPFARCRHEAARAAVFSHVWSIVGGDRCPMRSFLPCRHSVCTKPFADVLAACLVRARSRLQAEVQKRGVQQLMQS